MKIIKSFLLTACAVGCVGALAIGADNHHGRKKASSKAPAKTVEQTSEETRLKMLEKRVSRLTAELSRVKYEQKIVQHEQKISKAPAKYPHILGTYVVTSSYVDKPSYYDGAELVINTPSINTDARLLERRANEREILKKEGYPMPQQPRLVLSGKLEAQGAYTHPFGGHSTTDIDLTSAELDVFAEVTPLANGYITFKFDNTIGDNDFFRPIDNSRIIVDRAFITLGDFSRSPFYGTIGQLYAPFGSYASYMISGPFTSNIGKTKIRGLVVGYEEHKRVINPYARVFFYKGDTNYGNSNLAKDYGADLGFFYKGTTGWDGNLGASYTSNIANATGMVDTGMPVGYFRGFTRFENPQPSLQHNVEGATVYGNIGVAKFNVLAEYTTALRKFSPLDLSFNGEGARPSALNAEAAYAFNVFKRPSSIAVGYSRTYQALALNLPKDRYAVTGAMTILDNLIFKLEYSYQTNYPVGDTAYGQGQTPGTTVIAYVPEQLGKHNNSVIAQIGLYF